ncbi:MAG TPA: uroporphyrinogen decarboxylase family protein [Terracidiphilus sp.]|jgi:uroporphyrinogen decarboxylase|nr:uroporphyrinogen decarboxylase family protein [Terracidiphilus sp.]
MNDRQWNTLVSAVRGDSLRPLPTAFIIDSPWLPNWAGHTILDYFTDDRVFLEDNLKAIQTFPETIFLPGFWSEYGMCTEPSVFGSVSMYGEDEFPFARKVLRSPSEVDRLEKPDVRKYGLLPFVIKRLKHLQPEIEAAGHKIRFAVARGPLNIASFLMGTPEFCEAIKTDPERMHQLLNLVTDYLVEWIAYQREVFPTIDGIFLLDDIVGFISRRDFETFGLPYLKRAFDADVTIKFFHNDAPCKASAPLLASAGINLLNFGVQHTLSDMKAWTGNQIALMGNIPPRDVLAEGTPEDVKRSVTEMLNALDDRSRVIVSCGGGMPPGAPSANIHALIDTVNDLTR